MIADQLHAAWERFTAIGHGRNGDSEASPRSGAASDPRQVPGDRSDDELAVAVPPMSRVNEPRMKSLWTGLTVRRFHRVAR